MSKVPQGGMVLMLMVLMARLLPGREGAPSAQLAFRTAAQVTEVRQDSFVVVRRSSICSSPYSYH
jgi:hypothetical protein